MHGIDQSYQESKKLGAHIMFHVPNKCRHRTGPLASDDSYGNNGVFFIPRMKKGPPLKIIASDGEGWEHVSVSLPNRCPTWEGMCRIKGIFWDADDAVIQVHPPESEYVNNHPYCLHLWRKAGSNDFYERPPLILVGLK